MRFSVVVPAFNAAGTIARTLRALADQDLTEPYEVIVVDGGSTDGTLQLLGLAGPAVTVIHCPQRDPAVARNLGIEQARGEILAFTDADCTPERGWLTAGLRALQDADLVQGNVVPERPPEPYERTISVGGEHGLYETANLFVRRELCLRVAGFARVPGVSLAAGEHFGEDAWFAWRAKRTGAVSAFSAEARVSHAVFARSAVGYISERARCVHFPALVAAVPELRDAFLWRRSFLSPTSARFDVAVTGLLLLCGRRPWAVAAVVPYGIDALGEMRRRRAGPGFLAARVAADALTAAVLVRGSVRARTVVL